MHGSPGYRRIHQLEGEVEEQKVASIWLREAKCTNRCSIEIFEAIRTWDGVQRQDAYDPAKANGALKSAIRVSQEGRNDPRDLHQACACIMRVRAMPASNSRPMTPIGIAEAYLQACPARTRTTPSGSQMRSCKAVREDSRLGTDPPHRWRGCENGASARDLWEQVGHAAWACADPGIQFHDTVNAWHTCPEDGADSRFKPLLRIHVPRRYGL